MSSLTGRRIRDTYDFLLKLVNDGVGQNSPLTQVSDGIGNTYTLADRLVQVSSNDASSDYLAAKIVAGSNITVTETNDGGVETLVISSSGGTGSATDELLKVSSNDTGAGYLAAKLIAGNNVTLVENNDGGNETLTINVAVPAADPDTKQLLISSNDTTEGYLATKLIAGNNVTLVENNDGNDETLTINVAVPAADPDTKQLLISSNDTTEGYLATKLIAGSNITITENNDGGNETLTIEATSSGGGGSGGEPYFEETYSLAIPVTTDSTETLVIGGGSSAINVADSVIIGKENITSNNSTFIVGTNNLTECFRSILIGENCSATDASGDYGSGSGYYFPNDEDRIIIIGFSNDTGGFSNVLIGHDINNTTNRCSNNIFIGNNIDNDGKELYDGYNIVVGFSNSVVLMEQAISIGYQNFISSSNINENYGTTHNALSLGNNLNNDGENTINIGFDNRNDQLNAITIGNSIETEIHNISNNPFSPSHDILIGSNIDGTGSGGDNIIIGQSSSVNSTSSPVSSIAIGDNNEIQGSGGFAFGRDCIVSGIDSLALGGGAIATANEAVQIGAGTNNTADSLKFQSEIIATATGGIKARTNNGAPTDTVSDGHLVVNTSNNSLHFRSSSTWHQIGDGELNYTSTEYTVSNVSTFGLTNQPNRHFIRADADITLLLPSSNLNNRMYYYVRLENPQDGFQITVRNSTSTVSQVLSNSSGVLSIHAVYTGDSWKLFT